jgi:hypothetical protein
MKYVITESQFKRLVERGPNSPAYRGPEGYDDSCDCYIDEEADTDNIFSKIAGVSVDKSLLGKFKKYYGEDTDSLARLILRAIKENKVEKVKHKDDGGPLELEKKDFYINRLPITIRRSKHLFRNTFFEPHDYILEIPFLGVKGDISYRFGKKIWDLLKLS